MPLPNTMVRFNLPNGKSAFDPNSGKTSLMICNTVRTSVRDVANYQRSLPLLGSDRGEGSPSTSALGTTVSRIRSCMYISSSDLIDFLDGVDCFVLHVQRSYGGGTQRSRPPQMPRELLPLRNLALSSYPCVLPMMDVRSVLSCLSYIDPSVRVTPSG